jgi:PAS domain S-box-containing protein
LLNFIAQRSWIETKQEFLPALADCLGRLLKVDYALIDKLGDEPGTAETVGLYAHGNILPNLSYTLTGTPCENVIGKEICIYHQSVQQLFPEDGLLVDMKVEGYLGVPLWDSAGQPIGLIALLDSKPLAHADQAIAMIKLVAAAAGAELERLRDEKRLRQARDRAQGYLDTVEAMIIVLDRNGEIIQINRKGCQLLGWQESEMLGQSWFVKCLPPEEGLTRIHPFFQQLMAGEIEGARYVENEILTQSGQRLHMAWHNAVLRDEQGKITGTLSAGEDITERKQRDSELEGYRHHLEDLVDIRTHELAIAKERAESANRAKSVFLANMSHELRTPLNAILGFAQLLQHDPGLLAESQKKLGTINRSGQHLLALINDVLEISRIEAGHSETKETNFDLTEMLEGLEDFIRVRAEQKGLTFELSLAPELPRDVVGDAHHLKQILINLLGNAVKYTDRGHISLRVSPLNSEIQFEVSDTGQGIDLTDQKNIFQAFYQTEAGIAKGEGTGLGLAISREYAHLMGGELAVRSQPGQGSVFTLRVPLPATHAVAPSHPMDHGRIIGLATASEPPRILVVDDKADNRELVCQILALAGFQAKAVDNGQQAIDSFMHWQPHLIWMDMRMPVMDGYEATRQIRTLPGGLAVKIVALTASAFEEDRAAIMAAGCDDMVRTPVEEARLFQVMGELLGLHYRYQEQTVTLAPPAPARLDLLVLPAALRMELKTAAEKLDQEAMHLLVSQIRQDGHAALAQGLSALVAQYRFDRIADLCA